MPWKQVSAMDQREEFVRLALLEGANRRELCRRFGISPDQAMRATAAMMPAFALAMQRRAPTPARR